jgi:hypothetical protein
LDGWIKKGGATPDRNRTPARGALFGPNVLTSVKSEMRIKTEKDRIKKRRTLLLLERSFSDNQHWCRS